MREAPARNRLRPLLTAAYVAAALLVWLLLLDFSKKPLIADTDPSWMAALTYAVTHGLQFGEQIIYTYGPLVHLVGGTYAPSLFWPDFILELILKAIFVGAVFGFARRLPPVRRVCFLITVFVAALLSYQALYLFGLLVLGWLVAEQTKPAWLVLAAAAFFAGAVALIKFTFLAFVVLMLLLNCATFVIERRFSRAAIWCAAICAGFLITWSAAGQHVGALGRFFIGGSQVTSGYSQTMSIAAVHVTFVLGVSVALITALQLLPRRVSRELPKQVTRVGLVYGALFLAWKLGFVRADAHTAEFFYFAAPVALGASAFVGLAEQRSALRMLEMTAAAAVVVLCAFALVRELPGIGGTIIDRVRGGRANVQILAAPRKTQLNDAAANEQQAAALQLPQIKAAVGDASVDVLGCEQAVAVANRLNYTPNPTVQSYSSYTPALAELVMSFYKSARAPRFVLYKLQPIDDRVPTVENPQLLVHLLRHYEPTLVERGYVLLKKRAADATDEERLTELGAGESRIGHTIDVPPGFVWAQLEMRERRVSRVLSALYHTPEVFVEIALEDGRTIQRRLLPRFAASGFMINPMPWYESDVIGIAAGQTPPPVRVRSIRIAPTEPVRRRFKAQLNWRFSRLPDLPPPSESAARLYERYRGFADVLNAHATSITSAMPLLRFRVSGTEFLLVHPVGEVRFEVPAGARNVTGEFAIHPDAYNAGMIDGVTFEVEARSADGSSQTLFRKLLQPRINPADRDVQRFDVALAQTDGSTLILHTLPPPSGSFEWAWGGWANIRFNTTQPDER